MNPNIEKLNALEPHLLSKIKGQEHVISRVCSVLERGELGLQPPDKPLGSFFFLGPTGVGKTELTLEFSRYLFGSDSVFRFEMSEFLHLDKVKGIHKTLGARPMKKIVQKFGGDTICRNLGREAFCSGFVPSPTQSEPLESTVSICPADRIDC